MASKLLLKLGIRITAYTKAIGNIEVPESDYDYGCILTNPLYMPNNSYAEAAADYLDNCIHKQDSSGGMIECVIDGMPAGVGEPVFNKLDANLARAVMSIGAVKGVEIGDGFAVTCAAGSSNNDAFCADEGHITKKTNHAGGTLGGISDGSRIILRAAVKPTPSISQEQETVDQEGKNTSLIITGRHDPVIVPRAVVVVESMAAVTIADLLIANLSSRMDYLEQIYQRSTLR